MARAGFGGSGDYSSFLGSVYSGNKNAKRAQQDADDADAYDKWQNGLMSDAEWMTYIQGRVAAEAGDAKRQQKWVEYQRKFGTTIADNQAVFAYNNGGSINQLISHFQGRIAGMTGDSNEKRDLQTKLNELVDKRASEDIEVGAKALVDAINKGTKTYGDLKTFLTTRLAESRANSPLRDALQNQLDQVNETIRTSKLEGDFEKLQYEYEAGKLSAKAYAAKLRAMAQPFKANDPKRYYQILEAANSLSKGGSGGGGGGGGGGGSRKGLSDREKATLDSLKSNDYRLQALEHQWQQLGNGGVGVDPMTGERVVFTEDFIRKMDDQRLRNYDRMSAAMREKDPDGAARLQRDKLKYLSNYVVQHNTANSSDDVAAATSALNSAVRSALDSPDPDKAIKQVRESANDFMRFFNGLNNQVTVDREDRAPGASDLRYQTGPAKDLRYQVDGNVVLAGQSVASALLVISDPNATQEQTSAAVSVLAGAGGKLGYNQSLVKDLVDNTGSVTMRAVETKPGPNGEPPSLMRIATPDGIQWVKTVTNNVPTWDGSKTFNAPHTVPDVRIDDASQKWVTIMVDIGGKATAIKAIATKAPVAGVNTPVAKKEFSFGGKTIPKGARLGAAELKYLADNGKLQSTVDMAPAVEAWQVVTPGYTDSTGKTYKSQSWYMDDDTGQWYKDGLPIVGVSRDGAVVNGVDWKPFAHASGVPVIYSGNEDNKGAQYLIDTGAIEDIDVHGGRDANGNFDPNIAPSFGGKYYDPRTGTYDDWSDRGVKNAIADAEYKKWQASALPTPRSGTGDKISGGDFDRKGGPKANPFDDYAFRMSEKGINVAPALGPIESLASALGINLGTNQQPGQGLMLSTGPMANIDLGLGGPAKKGGKLALPPKKVTAKKVTKKESEEYAINLRKSEKSLVLPKATPKYAPSDAYSINLRQSEKNI